jgi:hypothetical protein
VRRLLAAAAAAALLTGAVALALVARGGSSTVTTAVPPSLPGQLTGKAPWSRNGAELGARLRALDLAALSSEGTALHIHEHLDVFVDGRRVTVPAGIGIDPGDRFISPLHTHDRSGVIHVESPRVRPFTLGEFIGVWGVRFSRHCLGGYCAGHGAALRVYSNGHPVSGDPGRLLLAQHQELLVAFGTTRQLPRPVPARYSFPPGL